MLSAVSVQCSGVSGTVSAGRWRSEDDRCQICARCCVMSRPVWDELCGLVFFRLLVTVLFVSVAGVPCWPCPVVGLRCCDSGSGCVCICCVSFWPGWFQACLHLLPGQCSLLPSPTHSYKRLSWNSYRLFGVCQKTRLYRGPHLGVSTVRGGWLHLPLSPAWAEDSEA